MPVQRRRQREARIFFGCSALISFFLVLSPLHLLPACRLRSPNPHTPPTTHTCATHSRNESETRVRVPAVPRPPPPLREEGGGQGGHHPGRRGRAHLALLLPRAVGHGGVRLLVRRTVGALRASVFRGCAGNAGLYDAAGWTG